MTGPAASKTVLLTGASGVLGTALLPELAVFCVIAAAHRRLPAGSGRFARIDLTSPLLGLDPAEYRRLCAEVDVVVHSAAIVNFSAYQSEVDRLNIEGLGRAIEFAAEADALMVHVSTAYVGRHLDFERSGRSRHAKTAARPDEYVASKHAGERIVRSSGIEAVIVRPSVVIGDSQSGEIRQSQAVHMLAESVLTGRLPFVPATENACIDTIPQDMVAKGVRALLDADVRDGDFWLTVGGDSALSVQRFLELVTDEGTAAGIEVPAVRLVEPAMVERLVRPAFADVLSPEDLGKLDGMVAVCSLVMTTERLPTSFGAIPGGPQPLTRDAVEDAWRISVRRLIQDHKLVDQATPQRRVGRLTPDVTTRHGRN
jgi:nucleoside-diphosphate-sugar epimerase